MVASVSPNCVSIAARRVISFVLNLHDKEFAIAVIDAVNSHEFIVSPLKNCICKNCECGADKLLRIFARHPSLFYEMESECVIKLHTHKLFYLPLYSLLITPAISSGVSSQPPLSHILIIALSPFLKNSM